MRHALHFIEGFRCSKIIVKNDNIGVTDRLFDARKYVSYLNDILEDCRLLACNFEEVIFSHVR